MNERDYLSAAPARLAVKRRKMACFSNPAQDQNPDPALRTAAWQSNLEALLKILIRVLELTEASFDTMFVVYGYHF